MEWRFEPSVVAAILVLAGGYLACVGPLRGRFAEAQPVPAWRQATYLTGVLVLALSLMSPLDDLAEEQLFSAHMLQHILMTLVVPPLWLLGTPGWLLRPALRRLAILRLARFLTSPVAAFLAFNVVFGLWHWPSLYDLALAHDGIHVLEHVSFVAAALLLWWPVCGSLPELPRPGYPVQLFYLFLNSLATGAPG